MKVLIVEDNESNSLFLRMIFESLGKEADFAFNGQEAIEKVTTGKYTFVLMDIHMPVLDGFDACKHIREVLKIDKETLPVVAATANAIEKNELQSYNDIFNQILIKPFGVKEIKELIEKYGDVL